VHENIATLRSILSGRKKYSPEEIDSAIRAESAVTNRMLALAEDYPDLKGNEVMGNLMDKLVLVENEVALMRDGYNDSVELYRTGSQRFPEVILARVFHFRDADFLRAQLEVRKAPEITLGT
jgi:LemA protein